MRKKILIQITVIVLAFMIILLVIMDGIISETSIRLFIEAKKELLTRDIEGIKGELFKGGTVVPELLDYCSAHPDEVRKDVFRDPGFLAEYKQVTKGLLERLGLERPAQLTDTMFPDFTAEEQSVYATMWFYNLNDYLSAVLNYYGFPGISVIDVSDDGFGRIICSSTAEGNLNAESIESAVTAENKRNGTLDSYRAGERDETGFGVAYSGRRGNWFIGYTPLCLIEDSRYVLCVITDLAQFNKTLTRQLAEVLIFSTVLIIVFAVLLIWFLKRKTVQPVTQIQKSVRQYADDKDTERIVAEMNKITVENEFGILAGDITRLAEEIDRYTLENIRLAAEHERLATELDLATRIQMDALPAVFPAFPDRKEFDLYALMDPAREVGGDFYDFFLMDDDHLCLVIADVSGKGVPGALFMMATKIILENNTKMGKPPAQILSDTNDAICMNNQEEMFVTVWLGILEISTGKLTAANAGHEYPAIRHAGGSFELFRDKHGFVIGGLAGTRYREYELQLMAGDKLFLYTDGVPEAMNAQNELFGTERMLDALNAVHEAAPELLLKSVRGAVDSFVKEADQFDDLTMLCLEYRGRVG